MSKRWAIMAWCLLGVGQAALAGTTTATNSGLWTSLATWNNGVPAAGDDVYLASPRSVILTNTTPFLSSLTVSNGAALTFNGTAGDGTNILLQATSVWVYGMVTHGTNMADSTNALGQWVADNRVWLSVSNLTVAANGVIHGDGRGYRGGTNIPAGNQTPGKGPGRSLKSVNATTGGAGYGGNGGNGSTAGGITYGSAQEPLDPGSGSGADHGGGFNGGGMIRVEASGAVTVYGRISANGQDGNNRGGGGSGGSVYLTCHTLEGSGLVTAHGGNCDSGYGSGGGGGGRVAVVYDTVAQSNVTPRPSVVFGAKQGSGTYGQWGRPGTVYFPDPSLLSANSQGGQIRIPGFTSWAPESLSISNGILAFPDAFDLQVTNDLRVQNLGGGLELSNSPLFEVGGNIVLTNYGSLYFYSPITNGVGDDYGMLVSITGGLSVASNSAVYPLSNPTNGGSVLFRMSNLTVNLGGAINADARGWAGGASGQHGQGPGRGENAYSGGGYGGAGAGSRSGYAVTYGSSNAPVDPGSGGGGVGGAGGGLIRMEIADTARLHGAVTANGGTSQYGGSGGGIYLRARVFGTAYGVIRAMGGTGSVKGGGGGRISLRYQLQDSFDGSLSVTNGGTGANTGAVGTISRASEGGMTLFVQGRPVRHEVSVPYDYGLYSLPVDSVVTNTIPVVAEQTSTTRYYCTGWTVVDDVGTPVGSGGSTQAIFTLSTNVTLTWCWTNQYHLDLSANTNGGLSGDPLGWYTNGVSVQMAADPDAGHAFLRWSGSGIETTQALDNPVTYRMNRPRTLRANFCSLTATSRTWTGTANWLSATNWAPPGLPSALDDVTLRNGTCTLTDPMAVADLSMSNGAVLFFSGTDYYGTNLLLTVRNATIDGQVRQDTNSTMATNGLGLWVPDNALQIQAVNLTLGTSGWLNADGRGFRGGIKYVAGRGPGRSLPSVNGNTGGAGHGGVGGNGTSTVGGSTYGDPENPVLPGSGSGGDHVDGRAGGGMIRVQCSNRLTIDGLISANGINADTRAGAGSGGAVYLRCRRVEGNGTIQANGGNTANGATYFGGGGGGGRIAIGAVVRAESLTVVATNGTQSGTANPGSPGTVTWIVLPPGGSVFVIH